MSKYKNIKIIIDGREFDSKKEGARYQALRQMENDGIICDLKRQIPFELIPQQSLEVPRVKKCKGGKTRTQRVEPAVKYFADFVYTKDGKTIVEDVKGGWMRTPEYTIKRKLMKLIHDIEIVEV